MHPVCLLQKTDDKDEVLLIGGLLYFQVAEEVERGHHISYKMSRSGAM